MYLMTVWGDVQSSKRMEYPTCSPKRQPTSSDTRFATDIAATLRGCVHAIFPCTATPVSLSTIAPGCVQSTQALRGLISFLAKWRIS